METKVLQPAHEMTTAQCVMECSGYLRTIANQEFEGEDWQTAPKYRRRNLLTDFLCNLELSGEEFAELCGFIGFQLSKKTTAKLAKFTVIAYDWQSEASGEATADILAALDKCAGVTLIKERGYKPQARTYDYLRFHIAAFWHCLVNELRSLCLGIGLVVEPKEMPATPAEMPRISAETAETTNASAVSEKESIKHISEIMDTCRLYDEETGKETDENKYYNWLSCRIYNKYRTISEDALLEAFCGIYLAAYRKGKGHIIAMNKHGELTEMIIATTEPPQSPETPQTAECKLAQTA